MEAPNIKKETKSSAAPEQSVADSALASPRQIGDIRDVFKGGSGALIAAAFCAVLGVAGATLQEPDPKEWNASLDFLRPIGLNVAGEWLPVDASLNDVTFADDGLRG